MLFAVIIFHECSSCFFIIHGFSWLSWNCFRRESNRRGRETLKKQRRLQLRRQRERKKKKARRFTRLWLQYSRQPQRYVFAARKCVRARVRLARGRLLLHPRWSPGSTPVWALVLGPRRYGPSFDLSQCGTAHYLAEPPEKPRTPEAYPAWLRGVE